MFDHSASIIRALKKGAMKNHMENKKNRITIGYSTHRPESLFFADKLMSAHDAIFLEDPRTPGFDSMLKKEITIGEYMMQTDTEYPEFTKSLCMILQEQHAAGKKIFQIEPFMDKLLKIHEFFADGGSPDKLHPETSIFEVYSAEKAATKELLNFYKTFVDGGFEEILSAVTSFAAADAARFRMRDKMRAKMIAERAGDFSSIYVEAGEIHIGIFRELRSLTLPRTRIQSTFLMAPIYKKISGRRHIFGPGDILTLHFIFQTGAAESKLNLMAARSLIYNKLLEKEEMVDGTHSYPHTRNEIETIKKVNSLSYKDCEAIFPMIRFSSTISANEIVEDFLKLRKLS